MATSAYYAWVRDGQPFTLIRPCKALRDTLRRHGFTVYDLGDTSHQQASTPEDHTAFSATGWPNKAKYGFGYALDIMPPAKGAKSKVNGKPLPSLQQLGAQFVKDRNANVAGISWLKYMNWEPQRDNGGSCWHDSWQPNFARNSSSDRGHIHISSRTGVESSAVGDGYDPVARIHGISQEDDMALDTADKNFITATVNAKTWGYPFAADASMLTMMSRLFAKVDLIAGALSDDSTDREQIKAQLVQIDANVGQVDEAVLAGLTGPLVVAIRAALAAEFGDLDTAAVEHAVETGVRNVLGSLNDQP